MTNSTAREDIISYIWDAYKDAHGHRPRYLDFNAMSMSELNEMAERVTEEVKDAMAAEAREEAKAVEQYEALITKTIQMGAGNRETAIRWIIQAESDTALDVDHIMWSMGLPFSNATGRTIMLEMEAAIAA